MKHSKITGKTIFISGGVGSIGSVIVEMLLENYSPKVIRIFDNDEESLFYAMRKYSSDKRVRFMLGDVRDKDRVDWALRDVNTVFHAAALKHVFLNEYNPFESIKTNVIGTQNLIEKSLSNNIETFINISTDKAVSPTNVMGATKLLSEKLTSAAKHYRGNAKTILLSVRFGNVLNSSGSVIPVFLKQLKNNQPMTITDKRMKRYFMTVEEAVTLILKASLISIGGEVFILKMPKMKILDLAEVIMEEYVKISRFPYTASIKTIGKKTGEKLDEKLISEHEREQTLELKDMYVIPFGTDGTDFEALESLAVRKYYIEKHNAHSLSISVAKKTEILEKERIRGIILSLKIFSA
ncbi:hypothetical protein A3D77_07380 [Candidatus Gottesmanbacteria bacterium RIFCSPHIGHO2_02_FULL_39_11]|uniref:Polysaccharide biosynthesis protein CapD-like domain-containing protein n=1 Tax=Candidatus Gottesmanbacteria bacterium RIFCSPHIGHO2_02_FULL_39_11 TaxID=1798382 RepID=A0A1F5ZK32_9BACT|nr:MAG: hypothetical protein A3D77_07380 [Candidatus Gottesmanbacteria bacterium RIFCSPHIGHO2_02_FULL_39_11]